MRFRCLLESRGLSSHSKFLILSSMLPASWVLRTQFHSKLHRRSRMSAFNSLWWSTCFFDTKSDFEQCFRFSRCWTFVWTRTRKSLAWHPEWRSQMRKRSKTQCFHFWQLRIVLLSYCKRICGTLFCRKGRLKQWTRFILKLQYPREQPPLPEKHQASAHMRFSRAKGCLRMQDIFERCKWFQYRN